MNRKESQLHKRNKMFNLIEACLSGDQTQKKFCRDNNINYFTFQSWLRKYRQSEQAVKSTEDRLTEKDFISLNFSPSTDQTSPVQEDFVIEYPNGVRFLLGADPDIKFIHELLKLETS